MVPEGQLEGNHRSSPAVGNTPASTLAQLSLRLAFSATRMQHFLTSPFGLTSPFFAVLVTSPAADGTC